MHRDAITATAGLKLASNFGRTFIYVATCSILLKMSGIWEINKNGFLSQRIYYFGQSLPPSSFAILNPTERNVIVPPWATPSLDGPRTPWAETAVNEQLRHLWGETRFVYCGRKSFSVWVMRSAWCRATSTGCSVTTYWRRRWFSDSMESGTWSKFRQKFNKERIHLFVSRTATNSGLVKHVATRNVKLEVGTAR